MVWYSHLSKSFPQFIMIHTVKGFGVVNETEVDVFLKFPCFLYHPANVDNLTSSSSSFSKTDFPGGSDSKASAYNAGDLGLIPGSRRSPETRLGEQRDNSPIGSDGKESTCNAGHLGLIPGLGISPKEGKG